MVMNGRVPKIQSSEMRPSINNKELERVTSYCYLGIRLSSNGKFTEAVKSLSQKGLGSLFSLRSTIDRRFIDPKNFSSLFTMLINPIITYGCQIWLPSSSFIHSLTAPSFHPFLEDQKLLSLIAKQPYEKILLRHSKYLLGSNRRSSNAAAWGETGHYPLFINCVSRCIRYFKRTIALDDSCLVKAAIKEQIANSLSWFSGIKSLIDTFDEINPSEYEQNSSLFLNTYLMAQICSPNNITDNLKKVFTDAWKYQLSNSSKLSFYNSVKERFGWEPYLDSETVPDFNERRTTAQIRSSSHKLNIETGRYNNTPQQDRTCDFCSNNPSSNPASIESEDHFLNECPQGADLRSSFKTRIISIIPNLPNDLIRCALSFAGSFPQSLQQTFEVADPQLSEARKLFIRTSCRHLHKMYRQILQLKKDLLESRSSNL